MSSVMKKLALTLVLLIFAGPLLAHKLAPSLLEINAVYENFYSVLWRTPRMSAGTAPEPVFPAECRLGHPSVHADGTAMEWRWEMTCKGGLGGKTLSVRGLLDSKTAALLRLRTEDGQLRQQLLTGDRVQYSVPAHGDTWSVIRQYLVLGIKHILVGFDHLLFVTGLLLLATSWRQLLATVTSFTIGHSLTLAMVSLGLIPNWPALVELGIAATILVLALELGRRGSKGSLLSRFQWPVAAFFGLIHGLGFASVLSELGLPPQDILPALLTFNIGIEIGQILFVVTLATVLGYFKQWRRPVYAGLRTAAIYTMGSMAVFWCLDRSFGLLGEFFYF